MNCCTDINIYGTTEHHQHFSSKVQLPNQQSSLNDKFNDGMDLNAILNPEPSASPTRSVQALDQSGLSLPSIEEILPSHEFRRLMQGREEEQTYVPITDINDPRAARFLREIQGLRTKWEQDEWHQLSDERGFRFDLYFWRSYHPFLQPIHRRRRYSNEMTQNATVQSPAHRSATPTKSAELVEDAGGNPEKVLGQTGARTDTQAAKYEKFDGDMESFKPFATDVSGIRSKKEDGKACSTPEGAATSPPATIAQPLISNQATVPTPQWAIKYQPGNLPLLGLEPGKWGDDITAYAPGKMPRPGRACVRDPVSTGPSLKFDWNWGLYTLLARIPGGRAKLDVLYQMCVEWCPAVNLKSHNNMKDKEKKNSTCRHSLSQNDCFISENKMWRLANISETKVKKPGPEKNKNPALTWKKRRPEKATSGAKKPKSQRRRRSTLNCESPSLHSALLISSFEPVCFTDFRWSSSFEKKAGQQDNTPDQEMVNGAAAMLSLSTPGFKAINSSSSGFTPINAPSGAPTTKRKLEDGNDASEQAATRRRLG